MKIIDNFLFRNEYNLLEIKLSTEYDQVDKFVIVESDYTFTGIYKGVFKYNGISKNNYRKRNEYRRTYDWY